ncbi:LysR family transcriptional regulator [Shewanella sp. Scap07]|uniref:LysR family transcriptional regulator n=1 Tax=Shewanella sp. Scap07 TaxID=2589987 RepID=UPI0015BB5885|nr:LysR family transcriptional regulator [Shewanella sp. Scap07]QLE87347.1 LysR family transcriptional regulator [Shewanella sp. Scap07]
MELEEVYRQDISLLIALQILVEERSVTQTAKRLHLSQSATSRILSRLRVMLNDPLFSRVGQQLVPTQFALDCYQQLQNPLGEIIEVLTPQAFVPQQCQQKFTIAATDFAIQALLPFVLADIYRQAPNISIEIVPVQHQTLLSQLSVQDVDVAICRAIGPTDNLHHHPLGLVGVSCLVATDHPLANACMSLSDYLHYPHVTTAISDGVKAIVDGAIEAYPPRKELLRTPYLGGALNLIELQPVIITLPQGMAQLAAEQHQLVTKPLPFAIAPLNYSLFWHSRGQLDKGQQWLRHTLTTAITKLLNNTAAETTA